METETKKSESGSPDPSLEARDGKTAGTESILRDEKPCSRMHDMAGILCISRNGRMCLHDGPCEPCDREGNVRKEIAAIPNEKPCPRCLKGTMFLAVEDDGTLWYVCNNKCCKHDQEAPGIIDAEVQQSKAMLAARDPKESLRQIRAVAKDIRQMLRNDADKTRIGVALNNIIILTGALP